MPELSELALEVEDNKEGVPLLELALVLRPEALVMMAIWRRVCSWRKRAYDAGSVAT